MSSVNDSLVKELIALLESSKIKDRNDGLVKAEQLASAAVAALNNISTNSLMTVINALFKTMYMEKQAYVKSKTASATVQDRLQKASSALRNIIFKIKDDRLRRKFKLRQYQSIVANLIDVVVVRLPHQDDSIFSPVALDLLKTLNILLEVTEFKDHLSMTESTAILDFAITSLQGLMNDDTAGNNMANEKFMVELLQAVICMCFTEENSVPTYLKTPTNYLPQIVELVRSFLQNIFLNNKKESLSLVLIFRILNHMLIYLSVRDLKLSHILARVGVRLVGLLNFTSFESLRDQITIFVNVAPSYLQLLDVPSQLGDNWNLDQHLHLTVAGDLGDSADLDSSGTKSPDAIDTGLQSIPNHRIRAAYKRELDVFIVKLLNFAMGSSGDFKLAETDVNLKVAPEFRTSHINWFNFHFMSLKRGSQADKAWLLRRGIVTVLIEYFRAKEMLSNRNTSAETASSAKRRKLSGDAAEPAADILVSSSTVSEFLISLSTSQVAESAALVCMQLLAFFMDSQLDGAVIDPSSPVAVTAHALNSFELQDSQVTFWSAAVLRATLYHGSVLQLKDQYKLTNGHINSMLNYSIDMFKVASVSDAACALAVTILKLKLEESVDWSLSRTSVKQLESLLQLSEINGPSVLSKHSIMLWFYFHDFSKTLKIDSDDKNTGTNFHIARKIQEWLDSKWNQISIAGRFEDFTSLALIVCWLCGASVPTITDSYTKDSYQFYNGKLFIHSSRWYRDAALRSCLLSPKPKTPLLTPNAFSFEPESLSVKLGGAETLLRKVRRTGDDIQMFRPDGKQYRAFPLQWLPFLGILIELITPLPHLRVSVAELNLQTKRFIEDEVEATNLGDSIQLVVELFSDSVISDHVWKALNLSSIIRRGLNQLNSRDEESKASANDSFRRYGDVKIRELSTDRLELTEASFQIFDVAIWTPERYLMNFIVKCGKALGHSPSKIFAKCTDVIEGLKSSIRVLNCCNFIAQSTEFRDLDLSEEVDSSLSKLLSLFANVALSSFRFERSELMVVVGSKLLSKFGPTLLAAEGSGLKQDCQDILAFLGKLMAADLVCREQAFRSYFAMEMSLLDTASPEQQEQEDNLEALISQILKLDDNVIATSFTTEVTSYLGGREYSRQAIAYNKFQQLYPVPQKSVELAASYCYFQSALCKSSYQLLASAIFNLVELAHFTHTRPYLDYTITQICQSYKVANGRELLKAFSLELFKFWYDYDLKIDRFPYSLFGYVDLGEFLMENHRAIAALSFVLKDNNDNIFQMIEQAVKSTRLEIVQDTLPSIVALGYTEKAVRSKILAKLKKEFSSETNFLAQVKRQLPLIIFDLFNYCDVSKEDLIISLLETSPNDSELKGLFNGAAQITYVRSHVHISPSVTLIAIETVLDLVGQSQSEQFWDLATTFFLVKRLLVSMGGALSSSEKVSYFRRLKFLTCLSGTAFYHKEIMETVVSSLYPYLNDKMLKDDICSYLAYLWSGPYEMSDTSVLVPSFVSVLSTLVAPDEVSNHLSQHLVRIMIQTIQKQIRAGRAFYIICSTLKCLEGKIPELSVDKLEAELENKQLCFDYDGNSSVFSLVSFLFSACPVDTKRGVSRQHASSVVAEMLIKHEQDLSDKFTAWKARYLGQYYSETGEVIGIAMNDSVGCSLKQYEANFSENVSFLDNVFLEMINSGGVSLEASTCIDYVLGVIISRNSEEDGDKSFLSYAKYFRHLEPCLLKMDLRTCLVLLRNSAFLEEMEHADGLVQTVQSLHTILVKSPDVIMTMLTLSVINEVATMTSLAPLMAMFISKIPSFSRKLFGHLIMFYIQAIRKGTSQIQLLLTTFYSLPRSEIPLDVKKMFIDLVLLIRVGSFKNRKEYSAVYKSINLAAVYHDAVEAGLPQTALMLMESHFSEPELKTTSEWQGEKEFLEQVYERLDPSADLIFGLPIEPSFEFGMKVLNRSSANPWNEFAFNSGFLDMSNATDDSNTAAHKFMVSASSMGCNGLSRIVDQNLDSDENATGEPNDLSYAWAWKLGQWDLPVSKKEKVLASENLAIYKTLKLVQESPKDAHVICLDTLQSLVHSKAKFLRHEHKKELGMKAKSWLRTLATVCSIEDILQESRHNSVKVHTNPDEWYRSADFGDFENILLGRRAAYNLLSSEECGLSRSQVAQAKLAVLFEASRYVQFARSHNESQKSINSAIYISNFADSNFKDASDELKEHVSKLSKFFMASTFWDQGETTFPVQVLKEIVKRERKFSIRRIGGDGPDDLVNLFPSTQFSVPYLSAIIVKWSSESKQGSGASIMDEYIDEITSATDDSRTRKAEIFHHFANFCSVCLGEDSVNQRIQKITEQMVHKDREVYQLQAFYENRRNSDEERRNAKVKARLIQQMRLQDRAELKQLTKSQSRFVQNAVKFYLRCISETDEFDETDVDRFCGLWLEYFNSDEVNAIVASLIQTVPSYKFAPWVNQLTSKLADDATLFQSILMKLLERFSLKHPFHSVYLIKSLRLYLDRLESDRTVISRANAAQKLWKALAMHRADFAQTVLNPIEELCNATIDLAGEQFARSAQIKLSKLDSGGFWLRKLPTYKLPPPTLEIPIRPAGGYAVVPVVHSVGNDIKIASSGISRPKIMAMTLSDGSRHMVLLKGGSDDLRQDAIMIQVFEKVNKIFRNYRDTRKRKLRIRTYKVVPLGPQSGMIEHVLNTVSLGEILKPLHEKQDQMKMESVRSAMKKQEKAPAEERIRTFYNVLSKVKPVMRSYFFSSYLDPAEWFENKLIYTRGVSVTSFVGYVLGLGDRHINNILIDKLTGEPIHIDFGITFDQGTRLPIPETVPFRLTRDVVDGFGVTGIEGCFIKTSEHVMEVLKLEKERIMDVLNILRYDPLYSWTLSPIRKQKLQEQGDMDAYQDTEVTDAIEGVRHKLDSKTLSVEAQVRELTQRAMDPDRLACIYLGWSPFY